MARLFSIYITPDITTICEVSKKKKGISLYAAYRFETPGGCVEDGTITDAPALAQAIRQALPEKGYKRHGLVFTISSRRIANKEILLPYVKNKNKIKEMIMANINDYFPMKNIQDYLYAYTILEVFEEEEKRQYRLSATAVLKEMAASYQELAKELGLKLCTIDYYGNSIFQISRQQVTEGNTLMLQTQKDATNVSIMAGQAQRFRRTVPFGEDADARDIVASILRVVDFHLSKNPGMIIEAAKILGEGGVVEGLAETVERELNIPVTVIEGLDNIYIKIKEGFGKADVMAYLPNLGAVIHSLDFRVEEEQKQKAETYRLYAIVLSGAVLISGLLTFLTLRDYYEIREKEARLRKDIAAVEDIEILYLSYEQAMTGLAELRTYYEGTKSRNEALSEFITDIEKTIPESVGISQMNSQDGDVNITGTAAGKEAVAAFIMNLKNIEYITDVSLKDITDTYDEMGNASSTFNLTFQLQNLEEGEKSDEIDTEG